MVTIGLDEARADIAGLLDRVEKGEDVLITRETKPSTETASSTTMEEALRELDKFRATMPPWDRPSAEILREMRDEGY